MVALEGVLVAARRAVCLGAELRRRLMGHAFSGQLPGGFYAVCCRFRYSL